MNDTLLDTLLDTLFDTIEAIATIAIVAIPLHHFFL